MDNITEILKSNDKEYLELLYQKNLIYREKSDRALAFSSNLYRKLIKIWTNIDLKENSEIDENKENIKDSIYNILLESELRLLDLKLAWDLKLTRIFEFWELINKINNYNLIIRCFDFDKKYIDYILNNIEDKNYKYKLNLLNYFNSYFLKLN